MKERGGHTRLLSALCEKSVVSVSPREAPDELFIYIDISAVDNVRKQVVAPQKVLGKNASVRARQVVRSGDILVAMTRPNLNAVALVADAHDAYVCSTGFCVLRCGDELDRNYLFSFVQSPRFVESLTALVKGALYPAVTSKQVLAQEIPWVPILEQRRIAARLKAQLAAAEQARQAAKAQLAEVATLRQAIYRDAFAHVIPVSVPPQLEAAPNGWHWLKLGDADVARLESGHTPSRARADWWSGDISWLSLTEIRAFDGTWVEATKITTNVEGIANSSARVLPRGTVCYSRTASVGFVAIMAQPMATSQDFANWVCADALDPEFLMHALVCAREELRSLATGATHKTIYMPTLKQFHVCAPIRAEQERIVANLKQRLASVDDMREAAQLRLADLEALPACLLAQAFDSPDHDEDALNMVTEA